MKARRKGEEHPDHIYFSAKDTLVTTKLSLALICLVKNAHRPKSNKNKQTLLIAGTLSCLPQGPPPKGRDPECDSRLSTEGLFFVSKTLRCFMYPLSCNPNIVSYLTLFLKFSIREDFIMCLIAQLCLTLCNPMDYTRLVCPWNFSGNNMRVACHFLLEGIFLIQGLNPHPTHLLHLQVDSLPLCLLGSPITVSSGKNGKKNVMQNIMQLWQNVSEYLHTCPHRTIVLTIYLSTDH